MDILYHIPKLGGQPYGERIYMANLLRALTHVAPADWRLSAHTVGWRGHSQHREAFAELDPGGRIKQRWTPVPYSLLRPLIHNLDFPNSNALFGKNDLVHSFTAQVLPATKNFVLTIHDLVMLRMPASNQPPELVAKVKAALNRLVSHAVVVHTISEFSKGEIVDILGIDSQRVRVIPNGVDHDIFHPLAESDYAASNAVIRRLGLTKPYLLHMGGSAERKNVRLLIEAYRLLRTRYGLDHALALVGSMPTSQLISASGEFSEDIHFLGYLNQADAVTILQRAEVLVFPSVYEGFGLPPLEAMSCGVPTALANTSSLPEVGGDAAVYFDPLNAEEIAQAVFNVISDSELHNCCRQRGLARAADFSWTRLASDLVALYESVGGKAPVLSRVI